MVDIRDYSSIYHLHIPRTSGVFLREHLLRQFSSKKTFATHYSPFDQDYITKCYYVGGHFGISPIGLLDNPLVFSILRNPVERFISYFKYIYPIIGKGTPSEEFDKWINDESISLYQSNTQTKFLSNGIDIDTYNQNLGNNLRITKNWFIENVPNINKAISFIDNNHIFILENGSDIYSEISNLLSIKNFPHISKINNSGRIDLNITKKQYAKIEELNSLDLEIYEYARNKEKR